MQKFMLMRIHKLTCPNIYIVFREIKKFFLTNSETFLSERLQSIFGLVRFPNHSSLFLQCFKVYGRRIINFFVKEMSHLKYIQWIKNSIDNHYIADDNFEPLSSDLRIKDGTASSSTILDAHKKYQE